MKPTSILIADDHSLIRVGIAETLQPITYINEIWHANHQKELWALLKAKKPDLLILDIHLGDTNGVELINPIREAYPGCKIVLFTGGTDDETMQKALDSSLDGFFLKIDSKQEIHDVIIRVIKNSHIICKSKSLLNKEQDINKKNTVIKKRLDNLSISPRQFEIFKLSVCERLSVNEIAEKLGLTFKTIEYHKTHIYKRLGIKNNKEKNIKLIQAAKELGIYNR